MVDEIGNYHTDFRGTRVKLPVGAGQQMQSHLTRSMPSGSAKERDPYQ